MRLAVISLGGVSSKNIAKEAEKYFEVVDHVNIKELHVKATPQGLQAVYKSKPLPEYDCIYIRGSFRYSFLQSALSKALWGKAYLPIHPTAFTLGHDKFLTLLEFEKDKIPFPETHMTATTDEAKKILENVTYPIILKIPSGTQGKGVMFADSLSSARSVLDTLEVFNQPYMIQDYMETNSTDLRIIVAGGKVIACMRRKATKDELRANIHMGGVGEPYELDFDSEQIAIKAAKAIKADVCAVDMLKTKNKKGVIEVNLSPGLKGITKATKRNVADEIARVLAEKTEEFLRLKKSDDYNKVMDELSIPSEGKQIFTNLNIKAGLIRLPEIVTKLSGFNLDEDVCLIIKKGHIEIKKV